MKKPSRYLLLILVGAVIGLLFASVSTRDFAMHLDRQVHDVNCSFTPGLSGPAAGETGCLVTMVSPYSSVLRSTVWGGVPISLAAMAVFAFLLALVSEIIVSGRERSPKAMGFLALATALPLATSLVMAGIALVSLDAICTICVGIYFGSALVFAGGLGGFLNARKNASVAPAFKTTHQSKSEDENMTSTSVAQDNSSDPAWAGGRARSASEPPSPAHRAPSAPLRAQVEGVPPVGAGYLAAAFAIGVAFVAVPVLAYVKAAPDHGKYIGTCGALATPAIDDSISLAIGPKGAVPAIEVLDPLCPACRQFETRLEQTGLDRELSRRAVLFPLDSACNWMIDESVHPGACAISEAMLCAGDRAEEVLAWSFSEQENIMAATKADATAAATMAGARFPELAACIGSTDVKARLNRALRWAVDNQLQVLTPQLFIGNVKLCDEDVDLGLAFALTTMIDRYKRGTLRPTDSGVPAVDDVEADDEDSLAGETQPPADEPAAPVQNAPVDAGQTPDTIEARGEDESAEAEETEPTPNTEPVEPTEADEDTTPDEAVEPTEADPPDDSVDPESNEAREPDPATPPAPEPAGGETP